MSLGREMQQVMWNGGQKVTVLPCT